MALRDKLAAWLLLVGALVACENPAHSDAVDALGPEEEGVKVGPLHRPGQPCNTCHGAFGPGEPEFSVAGTAFRAVDSDQPAAGAVVRISDVRGDVRTFTANDVGNFYVEKKEWDPVFPLTAEVTLEGVTKIMRTQIRGNAGCGHCHRGAGDSSHVPRVWVLP